MSEKVAGEEPFGKKMFEFIEVEIDEEVEEALMECNIGYTWFEMEVNKLQEIFQDMNLGKYKLISLSKRKFLIRKDRKESWEDLDKTDLSVWLSKIRQFEESDHIISRVVWLECRGLPMPAWKEDNLRAFTDRFRKWISWSYQSDGLGEFFNPLVCIDSVEWNTISDEMRILYKGQQKSISFVEVVDEQLLYGRALPMEFSQDEKGRECSQEDKVDKKEEDNKMAGKLEEDFSHVDQFVESSVKTDTKEKVNNDMALEVYKEDGGMEGSEDGLYKVFRQNQSSTEKTTEGKDKLEDSNKSIISLEKSSEDMGNSQSTLCVGVSSKLKVKSNRGRTRKKTAQPRNPFEICSKFRINRNKKGGSRNVKRSGRKRKLVSCVEVIPTKVAGNTVQEALEILATAEGMGLELVGDKAVVVQEIVQRLERREL
ncbi:hypothetical protein ACET3Z_004735 [Daucus carota]